MVRMAVGPATKGRQGGAGAGRGGGGTGREAGGGEVQMVTVMPVDCACTFLSDCLALMP
jgi:hypothetical protein